MTDGTNGFWDTEEELLENGCEQGSNAASCYVKIPVFPVDEEIEKETDAFFAGKKVTVKKISQGLDLNVLLSGDIPRELLDKVCKRRRHDYELMGPVARQILRGNSISWLRAWSEVLDT